MTWRRVYVGVFPVFMFAPPPRQLSGGFFLVFFQKRDRPS